MALISAGDAFTNRIITGIITDYEYKTYTYRRILWN